MTIDQMQPPQSSKQILLLAFLGSLVLHLLFFSSFPLQILKLNTIEETNHKNMIRVQRIKQNQGQIVDVLDQKTVTTDPVESDYLSDKNRKVEKQTRALQVQRQQTQSSPESSTNDETSQKKSKYSLQLSDKALRNITRETSRPQFNSSIASNYLPEITIGDDTLLNTKEFAFHTFYIRMKREIEGFWHPDRVILQNQFLHGTYITTVNVMLDDQGYLLKAEILKTSGIASLDQEAKVAIEKASPFPNPPKELLGPDQKIRVNWNFIFDRSLTM